MDLLRRRLHAQRLAGPPLERPEDVVRLLLGVQSQDYPGAKWSLAQRLRQGTDAAVDRAFSAGRILRTHVLRPTWHFVTPADIRWLLRLTGPRVLAQSAYQYPRLELGPAVFRRCHAVFERALRDGRHLTRSELADALGRAGIVARGQRLAYIVAEAELTGLVCSGAPRGKHQTYALLEERVPAAGVPEGEEALAELTLRFFTGHGPAGLRHFAWWASLTRADARLGLSLVQDRLARVDVARETYWLSPDAGAPPRARPRAYLIPEFDELILGYKDAALPDLPRARGKARWSDDWLRPVIVGGKRAGTWRRATTRGGVALETNLFARLDPAGARALRLAAERYEAFLGVPVRLVPPG
ncbi:MAG TPA: winged helix DNA-binding domain-containing protein [Gemmatimonadales bacterium]